MSWAAGATGVPALVSVWMRLSAWAKTRPEREVLPSRTYSCPSCAEVATKSGKQMGGVSVVQSQGKQQVAHDHWMFPHICSIGAGGT